MTKSTTLAEKMAAEYAEKLAQAGRRIFSDDVEEIFLAGYAAAAHQWIPVTPETMPEESGQYLVWTKESVRAANGGSTVVEDVLKVYYSRDADLFCDLKLRIAVGWMPLPTPPNQSNEKI